MAAAVMHKDGPALPPAHARPPSTLPHSIPTPACKTNYYFHPTNEDTEATEGSKFPWVTQLA